MREWLAQFAKSRTNRIATFPSLRYECLSFVLPHKELAKQHH